MRHPIEFYLNGRYAIEVITEDLPIGHQPVVVARYRNMPGCMAQAGSRDAAVAGLQRATEPYIRALYAAGIPLPDPDEGETVLSAAEGHFVSDGWFFRPERTGTSKGRGTIGELVMA